MSQRYPLYSRNQQVELNPPQLYKIFKAKNEYEFHTSSVTCFRLPARLSNSRGKTQEKMMQRDKNVLFSSQKQFVAISFLLLKNLCTLPLYNLNLLNFSYDATRTHSLRTGHGSHRSLIEGSEGLGFFRVIVEIRSALIYTNHMLINRQICFVLSFLPILYLKSRNLVLASLKCTDIQSFIGKYLIIKSVPSAVTVNVTATVYLQIICLLRTLDLVFDCPQEK